MKVTPVSRDCGITVVLNVTPIVVVFSFQRCQRTIKKNEDRPPKNEADVNDKYSFVCLFFSLGLTTAVKLSLVLQSHHPLWTQFII